VEDNVLVAGKRFDERRIPHIAAHKFNVWQITKVDFMTREKVIKNRDLVAIFAKQSRKVGADESRAACNKCIHKANHSASCNRNSECRRLISYRNVP
jgi:hypothetical protein